MNNNSNLAPLDAVSAGPPRAGRVVLLIVVMLCTALVATLVVTSSPSDTARELEASGAEHPVVDHAEVPSPVPPVAVEPPPVVAENPSRSPSVTALVSHDSHGHGGGQHAQTNPAPEPSTTTTFAYIRPSHGDRLDSGSGQIIAVPLDQATTTTTFEYTPPAHVDDGPDVIEQPADTPATPEGTRTSYPLATVTAKHVTR